MQLPRRILLVEDEQAIREVLALILKRAGYTVFTAETATEALARHNEEAFDLAIVDMGLDDLSGDRLAQKLAPLSVVILTGAEPTSRVPSNVRTVLQKPSSIPTLLETIANLMKE